MRTFEEVINPTPLVSENVHVFVPNENVNEANFLSKLFSYFSKFVAWFKDPMKLQDSITQALKDTEGKNPTHYDPKSTKIGNTVIIRMVDPKNSKSTTDWSLSKIAEMQDGTGIYQITGSTNAAMLKSLAGTDKQEDLAKNSVMAMIPPTGIDNGKPMTIKIVKNILPSGQDYISKTNVEAILPAATVEKALKA